jgi:hypothetical protein
MFTEIVSAPETSRNAAVMFVCPAAKAVTSPEDDTCATVGTLEVHFATDVTSVTTPSLRTVAAVS